MYYLNNYVWCSKSNWDSQHYDCRHLLDIKHGTNDFNALVSPDEEMFLHQEDYDFRIKLLHERGRYSDDAEKVIRELSQRYANVLKPHVIEWLNSNVKDVTKTTNSTNKGWCMGDIEYRSSDGLDFTLFFYRRSDLMVFCKEFSEHKKPTDINLYFDDIRKKLNPKTGKYETAS